MSTARYDGLTVCATTIPEQIGEGNRWPHRRITWQADLDLPDIERDTMRGVIQEAGERWQRVCGIEWVEGSGSRANILIRPMRDGVGGVLADCQIPHAGITERDTLLMRIDVVDSWTTATNPARGRVGLLHVVGHEIGHGLGIGHGPVGAWMQPTYLPTLLSPQDWDVVQARLRYDRPRTTQPEPTQPADPPASGGRRRFDGRVLRGIIEKFPGLVGIIGDPSKIPDFLDLPDGPEGIIGGDGIELASVRLTAQGVTVRIMGREVPIGAKQ